MGIRFHCSTCGHKLNVKAFQAGRQGICPYCGASIPIPTESTRPSSKQLRQKRTGPAEVAASDAASGGPSVADPGESISAEPRMPAPAATMPGTPGPAPAPPAASPTPTPTPADPTAEAPGAVWYVRVSGGGQYGPASADVMRSWLAEGRVSPDSLVWREGWRDWRQAAEVFPQLAAGQLDPQLGAIAASNAASAGPGGRASRRASRSRSTTFNAAIITVLILAVIVLLAVFIWVLKGGPGIGARSSVRAAPPAVMPVQRPTAR